MKRLPNVFVMAAAFVAPLLLSMILLFLSSALTWPARGSTIALWLPIPVAALTLGAAAARKEWLAIWWPLEVLIRACVTVTLFYLFIFMMPGWGLGARGAGVRANEYLHGR